MPTRPTNTQPKQRNTPLHPSTIQKKPALSSVAQLPSGLLQRMQADPQQASPQGLQLLQRTVGNRAVAQMLGRAKPQPAHSPPPLIQTSPLKVGPANDRYEREADRVAGTIGLPDRSQPSQAPSQPQRKASRKVQRAPVVAPVIGREGGSVDSGLENRLHRSEGGGSPLPDTVRSTLEPKLGADLANVKVHTDKDAVQLNRDLGAKAFTHGSHIYYGAGQSPSDLRLTAHEAVHTIQQGATSQVRRAPIPISTDAGQSIRRKFGFEVELPMLLTYTDPAATGAEATKRYDAQMGSGGDVAWSPAGVDFDVKVDHNLELNPLAAYEETTTKGRFPNGASIVELVSEPMDELTMTEKQVRARAKQMADWAKNKHKAIKGGQYEVVTGYYLGSNMPNAMSYQTTNGYLQATYGVKLSSVPELFRQTTLTNPTIANSKKPTETVHANLDKARNVASEVMKAIRAADTEWDNHVPKPESSTLEGWLALVANYLVAGAGLADQTNVGLAKNLIGQYFYKSDLGKLTNALPAVVKDRFDDRTNGSLQALYDNLLNETGRTQNEPVLPEMNKSVKQWVNDIIFNRGDTLLNSMKNQYSRELGPDYLGIGPNIESSVVMENRELQYLDPDYASKKKSYDKELDAYYKKNAKSKNHNDKSKLQKALAKMTDPKKWPMDKWGDMFARVYHMVRGLNSMGTTQMVKPTV